jgi:hypothetical protein
MQVPLIGLLKNKVQLYKNYNLQDSTIDNWPFWQFESYIQIINDITEDENKNQQSDDGTMGGFDPSSYMSGMSNMANKFKM